MNWFRNAIASSHREFARLCENWRAENFDEAMCEAAFRGRVEVVKLCKERGATDFDEAMCEAADGGHVEIVKLCRSWLGYGSIHRELFQYHHKREFFGRIRDELLPVAWYPDRFFDWCVDEEEKEFLKKVWGV